MLFFIANKVKPSKVRDTFNDCNTIGELDDALLSLTNKYGVENDVVVDEYLKRRQVMEGQSRNLKSSNEYSWLTARSLNEREEIERSDKFQNKYAIKQCGDF
jgi:hypothetical protein